MEDSLNTARAIPGCPWAFANDMRKMINNKQYRSQVFKAMFENEDGLHTVCLEDPILLPDISPDTFQCLLEFLYTNCCSLNEENVVDVLASAAEYSLKELQQMCGQFMADTLSLSSACAAMQVSVMYNLSDLRDIVLCFIEKHTEKVFKTEGFHELSEEALGTLLASNNLNVDEIELIGFLREWATVNSVALGKPVNDLAKNIVQHLRLMLLSPEELSLVEAENEKDTLIPVKLISDAWKFHALKSSSSPASSQSVRPRSGTKAKRK